MSASWWSNPSPVWHHLWLAGSRFPFPDHVFDLDVVCCTREECWCDPKAHRRIDLPLTNEELLDQQHRPAVHAAADAVVDAVAADQDVIVRCHWGIERSALVVAVALMRITGAGPERVVADLRTRRSDWVLDPDNGDFIGWLGVGA